MGTFTYNQTNFFICPSTKFDSLNIYTYENSLSYVYYPEKNRTFTKGDTCKQLLAADSNILLCSNENSLIKWDLASGNVTGVYNETYWSKIPEFKLISEAVSSLIVIEDGLIVKLVDIIKGLEIKAFGAGVSFTKSIVLQKSNYVGIHYNYEGKKAVELWDLSSIAKKYSWTVDLSFCLSVFMGQKHYIIGYKNSIMKKWDFLLNQASTFTIATNNIIKIKPLVELDQIKLLVVSIENEAIVIFDHSLGNIKDIIEKNQNAYAELIEGSYDQYNGLFMIKSNNFFLYNLTNIQTFKLLNIDLNSQVLNLVWNLNTNQEFSIIYEKNQNIYLEKWDISGCGPIDLMKDSTISFKSIIQIANQDENLILLVNQNNTISLFSPYSRKIIKNFPGFKDAVFTEATAISCPNNHLIIINGYISSSSSNQYRLFVLDMNKSEISLGLYKTFNSSINNLIYMNYRDLIAFENDGCFYVFDIMNQNYINSYSHNLGKQLSSFISLKNFPYILSFAAENTIYFWNIYEDTTKKTITNLTQTDISIKISQSITLNSYKTYELLVGFYSLSSEIIISFWDISSGKVIFQLSDTRGFQLTYYNMFQFTKNNIDYLIITTSLTNDIWNLNTQTLEKTFYLPKTQNKLIAFQSSENIILDISNNTLGLWDYASQTTEKESYSFCKQGYFLQNLTSTCEKCDSLCNGNCYGSQFNQCVTPHCNYIYEKPTSVLNSQCFDCSLDNYFVQDNKKCMSFIDTFTENIPKTFCFGCLDNFYYTNDSCISCSSYCQTCYGPSKEQCLECFPGYVYYNLECYKKIVEDSQMPLMIVFGIFLGFVVIIALLCLVQLVIDERLFCIFGRKFWKCLNRFFFDEKFAATKHKSIFVAANNDQSQVNNLINHHEVEIMFPNSNSARSMIKRTQFGIGSGLDHYALLSNLVNRFKGQILEVKDINRPVLLKMTSGFLNEIKEELPFFIYELIDIEQDFSKNNYFQIKIIKKICDGIYGPVFLGEKLCKTKFVIKIFFDNIDEFKIKKVNKFSFFLAEQEKIKFNSLQKISPMVALVYSSTKSNVCFGIMEEFLDYNLDDFLAKFSKNIHFIQKLDITLQILDGIKSLHDLNLCHRNIKANNILINSEDINYSINIKINDFSKYMKLSTMLYSCKTQKSSLFQLAYIPPEYFNKKSFQISAKTSDIWSVGVLIYDIFYPDHSHSLDLPWIRTAEDLTEKYKKEGALSKFNQIYRLEILKENEYCKEDPIIRKEITEIINNCLKVDGSKRIEIHELIWKIQWFKMKVTKE